MGAWYCSRSDPGATNLGARAASETNGPLNSCWGDPRARPRSCEALPVRSTTPAALLLLVLLAAPLRAQPALLPYAGAPLPGEPLAVLVHGINPVHEQLEPLAREVAARGYRALAFRYDDDQPLDRSARQLGELLCPLLDRLLPERVVIVAHSMGGLVARRALTRDHAAGLAARPERLRLLTIATPFGGFPSANFSRLDFGLGPKSHHDLGTLSRFIREPGELGENVWHYKVETDEKGRTRADGAGRRVNDDSVRLERQRQDAVDRAVASRWTWPRGHVGAIDDGGCVAPELPPLLDRLLGPVAPRADAARALGQELERRLGRGPAATRAIRVSERGVGHEARLSELRVARLVFPSEAAARRYAARARAVGSEAEVRGRAVVVIDGCPTELNAARAAAWTETPARGVVGALKGSQS